MHEGVHPTNTIPLTVTFGHLVQSLLPPPPQAKFTRYGPVDLCLARTGFVRGHADGGQEWRGRGEGGVFVKVEKIGLLAQ